MASVLVSYCMQPVVEAWSARMCEHIARGYNGLWYLARGYYTWKEADY